MAYCSASDIFAFSQNLTHGQPAFNEETTPTLTQINRFLSSGCAAIHTGLSSVGISVPVASGTDLYDRLSDLNSLFGAGRAELSRVNTTIGPGERTRGQYFLDLFKEELEMLLEELSEMAEDELEEIGGEVNVSSTGKIFVGGISQDSKDAYDSDSDRVKPRMTRNQFKFSDSQYPD